MEHQRNDVAFCEIHYLWGNDFSKYHLGERRDCVMSYPMTLVKFLNYSFIKQNQDSKFKNCY